MARPRLDQIVPELSIGAGAQLVAAMFNGIMSTRERMIVVAVDQLIEVGPVDFNSGLVCEVLNVKHPMIKHHFGSKENLLAEALIWTFRTWSRFQTVAIRTAKNKPEDQLRTFITAELEWAKQMKAMAVISQYPLLSVKVLKILDTNHKFEMQRLFEYHLSILTMVIIALRNKSKANLDFDATNYPRTELVIKNSSAFLAATSISWSTHGLTMWSTGDHLSTQGFATDVVGSLSQKIAIENHIKNIIRIAEGK